ncbi:gluconate 2-dehydrogenase subunit 3 family protein [Novosphingobium sp. SG707]|uniref:gluconate 2-dehydrogenase subunit 3 family protein n=1 Tax=Novosphingobium sp. SG707 TaxID=2586996 RepID=UPI001808303B|nr:gluconate 2-dehydrogenase subunit 3 family protein [Novosphingobium sp. SG707]NKJ01262.1 hypothetical protein [Novosphingobium sp. SG707]
MQHLRHKQPRATRREVLAGAAIFALATGLPMPASAAGEAPSPRIALLLKTVAQIVIPRSDTPGAGDVGVGAFLPLAFAHGLEGTREPWRGAAAPGLLRADGSLRHDLWLDQELNRRAGRDFLALPPAQQAKIVAQLDAEAFPAGPPPSAPSPWVAIKALILTGYYTSEAGASKELQYNLIPGRWDADIPLKPGARAYSSDWTAVEFG